MAARPPTSGGIVEGYVPIEIGEIGFNEALGYVRTLAARHVVDNPEEEIVDIGVRRENYSVVLWAYHYRYRLKGQLPPRDQWAPKKSSLHKMGRIGSTEPPGSGLPSEETDTPIEERGDKSDD